MYVTETRGDNAYYPNVFEKHCCNPSAFDKRGVVVAATYQGLHHEKLGNWAVETSIIYFLLFWPVAKVVNAGGHRAQSVAS